MEINDYILKLSGKVSVLEPLEISNNFKVEIEGAIISQTDTDNDDGTINRSYSFKPVKVTAIDKTGKTIKTKDPRGWSVKLRAWVYKHWESNNSSLTSESYYDGFMRWLFSELAVLLERYDKSL